MNFKNLLTLAIILSFSATIASAQTNVIVLDKLSLQNELDIIKEKGLPYGQGIFTEYKIGTNEVAVSYADSTQIVNNISAIKDVVFCAFNPSKHMLTVKSKKQENGTIIKQIKTYLIEKRIAVAHLDELNYKLNK